MHFNLPIALAVLSASVSFAAPVANPQPWGDKSWKEVKKHYSGDDIKNKWEDKCKNNKWGKEDEDYADWDYWKNRKGVDDKKSDKEWDDYKNDYDWWNKHKDDKDDKDEDYWKKKYGYDWKNKKDEYEKDDKHKDDKNDDYWKKKYGNWWKDRKDNYHKDRKHKDDKYKKDKYKKHYFDAEYTVYATPDQVVNNVSVSTPGQPGAKGVFKYGINVEKNTICYYITLSGVTGEYSSPAKTATHIHQGDKGKAGPPRMAFPNPEGPDHRRVSSGCMEGPFTTGILAQGVDTGTGFHVKQIVENPKGFFTDSHTKDYLAGAVRGQLGY